jgi:hypothetical protein
VHGIPDPNIWSPFIGFMIQKHVPDADMVAIPNASLPST